jgi:hypothetical protein
MPKYILTCCKEVDVMTFNRIVQELEEYKSILGEKSPTVELIQDIIDEAEVFR